MDYALAGSSRVLAIPELVDLIASYSEPSDITRLAQVGRRPFNILVPSIWKDLRGAHNLLRLIESAELHYKGSYREINSIKLPKKKNCDIAEAFRRFDIYAPFITTLYIHSSKFASFVVIRWGLLTSRAKQGPLLPNLKELIFDQANTFFRAKDEIQWITTFSHGNLRALHSSRYSELTSSDTSVVLDILLQKCPNIQELSLYPRDTSSYRCGSDYSTSDDDVTSSDNSTGSPDSDAESEYSPWDYLSELTQLRSLSVTDEWLGRSFLEILSRLPTLHTLEFRGQGLSELWETQKIDSYLPKRSFHTLLQLSLCKINPRDAIRVLGSRKMLRNIKKFRLEYEFEMGFEEREELIVGEILPMLANLPCLTELNIKEVTHIFNLDMDEVYMIARPNVLEAMAKLPLETVYLGHMHLGTGRLGLDLASIWPNVTELLMPSQLSSVKVLSYFAALPSLTRLVLRLDFSRASTPVTIPLSDHAPLKVLESGYYPRLSRRFDVLHHNARVLLQLWPELESVTWSQYDINSESLTKAFNEVLNLSRIQWEIDEIERQSRNQPSMAVLRSAEQELVHAVWQQVRRLTGDESSEESSVSEEDD